MDLFTVLDVIRVAVLLGGIALAIEMGRKLPSFIREVNADAKAVQAELEERHKKIRH